MNSVQLFLFRTKFAVELVSRLKPRSLQRIIKLKEKTEANTEVEVVTNALRLYEALIEDTEGGKKFFTRDANGQIAIYQLWQT